MSGRFLHVDVLLQHPLLGAADDILQLSAVELDVGQEVLNGLLSGLLVSFLHDLRHVFHLVCEILGFVFHFVGEVLNGGLRTLLESLGISPDALDFFLMKGGLVLDKTAVKHGELGTKELFRIFILLGPVLVLIVLPTAIFQAILPVISPELTIIVAPVFFEPPVIGAASVNWLKASPEALQVAHSLCEFP